MTYASGQLIQATDYNGFVSTTANANINAIWGQAGSATIGYGQGNVATVSVGSTVTATQWATLNSTLTSIGVHQNTVLTSRTTPTAGATITILSNLGSDIGNCYTNRLNAYATGTQYTAWTGTSSKTTPTGSGNAAWSITFTHTVSFANATATNNFFNAGGLIKIQFSKSSTGTDSDADWNNLANNVCGTVWLSSDAATKRIANVNYTGTTVTGGSGTPSTLLTGTGFYQLTGSPVIIYKQFDNAYTYTSNFIQVSASYGANAITLTTVWNDAGDATPFGSTNDISGGTATSGITFGTAPATVVTYLPPETSFLTNTWGTPTVSASVV
jgi:hypothetical protein